ncbi:MAG: lambda-exonuclease family protein, partial [Oceanococcaceae bacterium]
MKTLAAQQGTSEWIALRSEHYRTASRASAMMGASPYQSRQQLLAEIHRGFADEVDENTQRLFDRGHAIEEVARPAAEKIIGEELFPVTGLSADGYLLASFDGLTMLGDVVWECKTYSQAKAEEMAATGHVPISDAWQVVQQLVVSGATKCLYMLHDG